MIRKPTVGGRRLDALIDERARLRIRISWAEGGQAIDLRRRLSYLEQEIEQQWGDPAP